MSKLFPLFLLTPTVITAERPKGELFREHMDDHHDHLDHHLESHHDPEENKKKAPPKEKRSRPKPHDDKHHSDHEKSLGGGDANHKRHGMHMQGMETNRQKIKVEENGLLPWADFFRQYVRTNTPVIFRNTSHTYPAARKWSDSYMRKKFGHHHVDVEFEKSEVRGGPTQRTTFKKFIRNYMRQEYQSSRKLYAVIPFEQKQDMLDDMLMPKALACEEIFPQSMTLWMSSGGTSSVLHQDDAENFLIQVTGRKSLMLVNQQNAQDLYAYEAKHPGTSAVHQDIVDLEKFPRFADIPWLSGDLEAGDVLYIPHGYWHQVNSFGSRNLAINVWWGHQDEYTWWDPDTDFRAIGHKTSTVKEHFNTLKGRYTPTAKCTTRSTTKLQSQDFVDEGDWKDFVSHNRKLTAGGGKPVDAKSFLRQRQEL